MSSSSPINNNSNNNNASSSLPPNYRKTNITQPGPNDILCGRGGGTNAHSGNIKFRKLVAAHKLRYLAASKSDKPGVARDVVREWRAMDPPGRFLAKSAGVGDPPSSAAGVAGVGGVAGVVVVGENGNAVWHDVGDKKAREKASQCLRERNGAANEAVAALVKTVTASGEACPEDYATLMNKAAYVKAKNDLTIREQNERMRLNTMRNGGGGANGGGVNVSGMGSASRIDARGRGGGGNNLYQEAFEPISLNQQRFSPGSGFEGNNNNSINNNISGHNNNNNANNMEDDMIEVEIQRLLMQRQQQLMARRNNASNNMGNNGGGGGGAPQAYMGEESVMREYEQLMRKQRELNIIAGKLGLGGNGNGTIGGGGGNAMGNSMGMMNTFNTNGMNSHMMSQASGNMLNPGMNNMMNMNNGMGGGGGNNGMGGNGNNYGNGNTSGSMQSNHNPDAAKDYMQRLRSLRQGGTSGGGNNMGGMMPDPLISSSQGYGAYGNVGNNNNNMGGNNNGLGLSGGNMSNNMMMNNMMNNMQQMQGNKPSGGRGVPEDFTIEEYQASLQQFLSHTDDFGGGGASNEPTLSAADRMALEREMAAKGLANNSASSSSRQYNTNAGGRHVHVATNLEDGNSRNGNNNNNADMEGSGSADMDINRDTFKSVDSADRPSFQSFKTVDTMDIRNTFKSVDTMDLMSIGNSINEIMDDELKQHPEMRKKYGRRLSNASSSNRYSRGRHDNKIPPGNNNVHGAGRSAGGGAAAAAATLSDFANHPSRTLEIKTLDHGNGRASGGPKKIRKAMDPRAIDPRLVAAAAKAGRHSVQTKDNDGRSGGGRGSMLSIKDLNFDGVDDTSRMSFGNISVMSELTDFQEMMAKGQDSYNQL